MENIKNLKEMLAAGNLGEYDFSDDGASREYTEIDEPLEKFFVYSASECSRSCYDKCNEKAEEYKQLYGTPKDPDSKSKILQCVYKLLWNDDLCDCNLLKWCKDKYEKIKGETLNSVFTTLNQLYSFIESKPEKNERGTNKISKSYLMYRYADGNFVKSLGEGALNDAVTGFMSIYHTLGNFIPFPTGCNAPRGTGSVKDYWDITLKRIFQYYQTRDIDNIFVVVGTEVADIFKKWLDTFGSWENFVESNYLQPFVDEESCYPKELWKDHFGRYNVLPRDIGECIEYFKNAAAMIKKRSKLMTEALNEKLEGGNK